MIPRLRPEKGHPLDVALEQAVWLFRLLSDPLTPRRLERAQAAVSGAIKAAQGGAPAPVPVCILGTANPEFGVIERDPNIYGEDVLCPEGVQYRIRQAREFQCGCGGFHGDVPQWVLSTLGGRLRLTDS